MKIVSRAQARTSERGVSVVLMCDCDWRHISEWRKLSEDFIRRNCEKVNWLEVTVHQKLSEEFMREFESKICWEFVTKKLSESFCVEFFDRLSSDHPMVKSLRERFVDTQIPESEIIENW